MYTLDSTHIDQVSGGVKFGAFWLTFTALALGYYLKNHLSGKQEYENTDIQDIKNRLTYLEKKVAEQSTQLALLNNSNHTL